MQLGIPAAAVLLVPCCQECFADQGLGCCLAKNRTFGNSSRGSVEQNFECFTTFLQVHENVNFPGGEAHAMFPMPGLIRTVDVGNVREGCDAEP